jgi:hypothetical protein
MNNEGCSNCFGSQKGIDKELSIAIAEATKKAMNEKRSIAIVRESNVFVFYDAFYAYQNGLGPNIKTVVSWQ